MFSVVCVNLSTGVVLSHDALDPSGRIKREGVPWEGPDRKAWPGRTRVGNVTPHPHLPSSQGGVGVS